MAIAYATATGNARLAATLTAAVSGQSVDGNSGPGLLVIGTSTLSGATGILCTVTLPEPSHSISAKAATLLGVPLSATATTTGTAALAEFRDSAGNSIVTGLSVGTSGANINLGSIAVTVNQTVTITSGNINSP